MPPPKPLKKNPLLPERIQSTCATVSSQHTATSTVTPHLLPAAGEEMFHRVAGEAKRLQNDVLENRPFDSRLSFTKQQAIARKQGSRGKVVCHAAGVARVVQSASTARSDSEVLTAGSEPIGTR